MNNFTDETFESIWSFAGDDERNYTIVHEKRTDIYKLYQSEDVEEIAYTNYTVKENFIHLTGTFFDSDKYFYAVTENNILHCNTGAAVFLPCGLNSFRPREEVMHYLVYGKIMSQYSWLTWVKGTDAWPIAMASLLGSKSY